MIDPELATRIVANPDILGGKPTIRGTRISVELVLAWLAQGGTAESIVEHFEALESDDVLACLAFAYFVVSREPLPEAPEAEEDEDVGAS